MDDKSLLWIEKYRPKNFNEILGQSTNIKTIENVIKNGSFPHMIFNGKSGTGKTSTIMAVINKLYGKNTTFMVMKLDASDDRGINAVRDEIKGFAEKITLFNQGIKVIILDEADSMTFDAQFALRRIIEKYSDTTRFCLICNYENKIIPPIKSRCVNFRFNPIKNHIIVDKLKFISEKENIKEVNNSLNVIAELANGDLRKAINLLQSISMRSKEITEELCYETAGVPNINDVEEIYFKLIDKDISFNELYQLLVNKIIDKGISLSLFLGQLTKIIFKHRTLIDQNELAKYLNKLAHLEYSVSTSTFGTIYVISLIGIFKKKIEK